LVKDSFRLDRSTIWHAAIDAYPFPMDFFLRGPLNFGAYRFYNYRWFISFSLLNWYCHLRLEGYSLKLAFLNLTLMMYICDIFDLGVYTPWQRWAQANNALSLYEFYALSISFKCVIDPETGGTRISPHCATPICNEPQNCLPTYCRQERWISTSNNIGDPEEGPLRSSSLSWFIKRFWICRCCV